jgi:hypothetical protein
MEELLARLGAAGIHLIASFEETRHFAFQREGFLAIVVLEPGCPPRVGGAGLLTEKGLAPLIWRGDRAFFVARGFEQPAAREQVAALRNFQDDLRAALVPPASE